MKTNGRQVNKVRIRFRPEIRKDAKVWINGQEVGRLAGKPASDVSVGIFDVDVYKRQFTGRKTHLLHSFPQ